MLRARLVARAALVVTRLLVHGLRLMAAGAVQAAQYPLQRLGAVAAEAREVRAQAGQVLAALAALHTKTTTPLQTEQMAAAGLLAELQPWQQARRAPTARNGAVQAALAPPIPRQRLAPRAGHPCEVGAAVDREAGTRQFLRQPLLVRAANLVHTPPEAAARLELTAAQVLLAAMEVLAARQTPVVAVREAVEAALRLLPLLPVGMAARAVKAAAVEVVEVSA